MSLKSLGIPKIPYCMQKELGNMILKSVFSNHCFVLIYLLHNSFFHFLFSSFKPRTPKFSAAARASTAQSAMVVTVWSLALLLGPAVEGHPPEGSLISHTETLCWPGCWRTALEATLKPSWLPVSGMPELDLCWDWYSISEKGPWPPRFLISSGVLYSMGSSNKASD